MKIFTTTSTSSDGDGKVYTEFTSSADAASKTRTRLKKLEHTSITSAEHDLDTTRTGLIAFLNARFAAPAEA